jgi:hypothetical protein
MIFASWLTLAVIGGMVVGAGLHVLALALFPPNSCLGEQMGEVIQFIRKPDPDREARLIQEARAIYESIFPTEIASIAPIGDDDTSP